MLDRKNVRRRERYRYVRTVLKGTVVQAKRAQRGIEAMKREFPGHLFPEALITPGKPGRPRPPAVKYGKWR